MPESPSEAERIPAIAAMPGDPLPVASCPQLGGLLWAYCHRDAYCLVPQGSTRLFPLPGTASPPPSSARHDAVSHSQPGRAQGGPSLTDPNRSPGTAKPPNFSVRLRSLLNFSPSRLSACNRSGTRDQCALFVLMENVALSFNKNPSHE